MERLTGKDELGYFAPNGETMNCLKQRGRLVDRLAAYEDTGLTAKEVVAMRHTLDEYHKVADPLLRAQADERVVVLPCRVGDTVYVNGEKRTVQATIDEAYLDDVNNIEYLVSFDCKGDCDGCPFNSWHQDHDGEYSCDGEWGQALIMGTDFGKTVFLTREEAEEALRRAENG